MDNSSRINVIVPKDYNGKQPIEVVLREGAAPVALDPKEPELVRIKGTIEAPLRWLEKRIGTIEQIKSHIVVNRDAMSIKLIIEEKDYYQTIIFGSLQTSKEMASFGINNGHQWEPSDLSMFFKMNRAFFKNKTENMSLVSILRNLKAKVVNDIERSKEQNGSKTDSYSQVVDSNLPESFKINIPLFKGFAPEEIEVETMPDINGRDVTLSLISAGANETIENYKNKTIDGVLEAIKTTAPDIVIIET